MTIPADETDAASDSPAPAGAGPEAPSRALGVARALPPFVVLAVGVAILTRDGGFDPETWYPAALLCLGLAVVMAYVGVAPPDGVAATATAVLAGYVVLTFLSVLWADVDDVAWQGANLTLLYAIVFSCTSLGRLTALQTAALVTAFGGGIALVGVWTVARGAFGDADPADAILYAGRLSEPTGYPNATAAVFAIGLWAMLGVALQADLPRGLRAAALGLAGVLAGLNLLCQSRGSVFTLPAVIILFLVLAHRRGLAAGLLAVVGAVTAAAAPVLLDVFPAATAQARRDTLADSFVVLLAMGGILAAAGLALPRLDRLPSPAPAARRRLRLVGVLVALAVVAGALALGSPGSRLSAGWDSFKNGGVPQGTSRFVGLGSNRYDFWRVGLEEFREHPVVGIGVDNFSVPYLERRRSLEQPLYPHSLWVRVASQTGVVGSMLLVVFFALAAFVALRRRPGLPRSLVGGLLTGAGAWLAHAQVDWLWEMPALGFAAFALLGLAVGVGSPRRATQHARGRRRLAPITGIVLALIAAVSFGVPWLGARYESRAVSLWSSDPAEAVAFARRAATIDPVRDDPLVLAGAMHSRLHEYGKMRDDFAQAVGRNPFNWYAELELAVAYSALGRPADARRHARRAAELNPRDPIVRRTRAALERGDRVDPASVDRAIVLSDPT